MKKAVSLAVMAILLISILPLSLAEDQNSPSYQPNTTAIGYGEKLREKLKEIQDKRMEELKALQENPAWAKYNATSGFKARILENMTVGKIREDYMKAKEQFQLKKIDLEKAKLKFQGMQEIRKQCKAGNCNITDEELIASAKEFLGNSADAIIEHLNKVKAKIQENEDLSDDEANAMIAQIDEKIAEIEAAKEKAQNATTKEEIRDAAKDINAAWKDIKITSLAHTNQLINARIGGIIVKSEHLKEKLDKILARMEANGKDVSNIKPMVDEFNADINLSKEKYDAAMEKFKEFWQAEDKSAAQDKLKEAQDLMNEAKQALKDANEKLREIVKAIKEKNGEQEIKDENKAEEGNQTETAGNETS